jgi:hypothetical protein
VPAQVSTPTARKDRGHQFAAFIVIGRSVSHLFIPR